MIRPCEVAWLTNKPCNAVAAYHLKIGLLGLFMCEQHAGKFPDYPRTRIESEDEPVPVIVKDNQPFYNPAPEGLHQAVCVDVIDRGIMDTKFGPKQQVDIRWQLDQVDEDSKRPFQVMKRYNPSLNEKANLRKDLESWRGKKFTKEELTGFDVEKLIGINCQLQIVHNLGDGSTVWANIQAIVPLGKGMVKIQPKDYVRDKDRDPVNGEAKAEEVAEDEVPF